MNFIYLEYKPRFDLIEISNDNDHILSIMLIKNPLEDLLHNSKIFYDEFDFNSNYYHNEKYIDPNYVKIHGKDYIEIPYDHPSDNINVFGFSEKNVLYFDRGYFQPRRSFYHKNLDADIICSS